MNEYALLIFGTLGMFPQFLSQKKCWIRWTEKYFRTHLLNLSLTFPIKINMKKRMSKWDLWMKFLLLTAEKRIRPKFHSALFASIFISRSYDRTRTYSIIVFRPAIRIYFICSFPDRIFQRYSNWSCVIYLYACCGDSASWAQPSRTNNNKCRKNINLMCNFRRTVLRNSSKMAEERDENRERER